MKNINFDNPYLLLIAIPLLAMVIVPFILAIRKDNAQKSILASFILHLFIVVLVTLALAGTTTTTVMTETNVYVVCDLSYSAKENTGLIDEYIGKVEKIFPDAPSSAL